MANDATSNPWVIDTASANLITPFGAMSMYIDHFEFVGYALDTDSVIVQNGAGKTVWTDNGASDLRAVKSGRIGPVHGGLKVPTLTSGKLYVYFSK